MKQKLIFLIMLAPLFGVGCAKQKSESTNSGTPYVQVPTGPYVPPTTGPGGNPGATYAYGATAPLTIPGGMGVMSQYTGHPMNAPQNIVVNVNLSSTGTGQWGNAYGGTVTIGYQDTYNGVYQNIQGYFTSGTSTDATQYNIWFSYNGSRVFHAFFEDFLGGIILVINGQTGTGDGPSGTTSSGSVWFKNFTPTYAPHPPTYCWFVSLGPYNCQAWNYGGGINTNQADNPDWNSGYLQLGTFSGLDLSKAFNGASIQ